MTTRLPYSGDPRPLWNLWDEFGIQDAETIGYWSSSCPVRTDHEEILATAYVRPDKAMISIASWAENTVECHLKVDYDKLGKPILTYIMVTVKYTLPSGKKLHQQDIAKNIKKLKGEINVTVLNTHIIIEDVTGPIVANTTNGNIEVNYNVLSPNKPNAITSVNGFVDITLPANTKGQLALNSVNGEAYTDFDIKIDKNNIPNGIPSLQMTIIEGTINGGGSPINISTVNGDIYLRKKK